jgi:predicted alpha/beta superfamily hydrolase
MPVAAPTVNSRPPLPSCKMRLHLLVPALAVSVAQHASAQSDHRPPTKCTATGDLEIREFRSTIFHNSRKLRILLPQGYHDARNASATYPVLYLNDGQNLFDVCTSMWDPKEWQVDETADRLIAGGKVQALIIVGIDNAGKHDKERLKEEALVGSRPDEYLPWPDEGLDPPLTHVHGANYPKFLTTEVMPFVETNYRIKKGPENTGLGGSSYGGLIAFYTAAHVPGVFGRLLIESPSMYVHDFAVLKDAAQQKDWPARLYFGAGKDETPESPGAVEGFVTQAVKVLNADGVNADRIRVNITPGQHNEDAWAARFPTALAFLFPREH